MPNTYVFSVDGDPVENGFALQRACSKALSVAEVRVELDEHIAEIPRRAVAVKIGGPRIFEYLMSKPGDEAPPAANDERWESFDDSPAATDERWAATTGETLR